MKLNKKVSNIMIFSVLLLCFSPIISHAAMFTIDIKGLPEPVSGIQSFSIWFSVDDTFSFSDFAFGDAVPQLQPGQELGWDSQSDIVTGPNNEGLVFKVGGIDQDGLFISNSFDLLNGVICTFEYSGIILGVTDVFQLSDHNGDNQVNNLDLTYQLSNAGLNISKVPLPSALVLLGGGLLGMIGIRRKTMN